MSLLLNMLSRLVITFLPRSKRLLISWLQSPSAREMQVKTTVRYHLTHVTVAIFKKMRAKKCWQGCGEKRTLVQSWWEGDLVQPLWKTVWRLLRKLNRTPIWSVVPNPLLGIYLKKMKSLSPRDICTLLFTAALVIVTKTWKQPKCPQMDN